MNACSSSDSVTLCNVFAAARACKCNTRFQVLAQLHHSQMLGAFPATPSPSHTYDQMIASVCVFIVITIEARNFHGIAMRHQELASNFSKYGAPICRLNLPLSLKHMSHSVSARNATMKATTRRKCVSHDAVALQPTAVIKPASCNTRATPSNLWAAIKPSACHVEYIGDAQNMKW